MSADPALFVFGHLATPEHLAEEARRMTDGLFHGSRIVPRDPLPNQDVELVIEAGAENGIDEVTVRYTLDGSRPGDGAATVKAQRAETRWDDLAWRYVDRWSAVIPGQPDNTTVRYTVQGTSSLRPERLFFEPSPGLDAPDVFTYRVDELATPSWLSEAVIYQIFVDRFFHHGADFGRPVAYPDEVYGGTVDGIVSRLDYLADLGINTLWLTPVFETESCHGYDAIDYEAVSRRMGGSEALHALVESAHARGIRVLLDIAANHCSWHNPKFVEARSDPGSRYREWFSFNHWPDDYRTFFGTETMPELNTHNDDVVTYLAEAAARYVREFGVDGYRLDYAIGPPPGFWSLFRAATRRANPSSYLVGEVTLGPEGLRSLEGRLDGCLDFPLLQLFRQFFVYHSLDAPAFHSVLERNNRYYSAGYSHPTFLDNHDMNRFLWVVGGDTRRLKLAATCQFSLPQPPIIYYGTEVGLSQTTDVAGFGFEACRAPMLWGDAQDTELLTFYRRLIEARRRHPSLRGGSREVLFAQGGRYAYACTSGDDRVVVALNNSDETWAPEVETLEGVDLLTNADITSDVRIAPYGSLLIPLGG